MQADRPGLPGILFPRRGDAIRAVRIYDDWKGSGHPYTQLSCAHGKPGVMQNLIILPALHCSSGRRNIIVRPAK